METAKPDTPPGKKSPRQGAGRVTLKMLREENEALKRHIATQAEVVAENELIWRHFAAIERILFRTRQLDVLVEELLTEIRNRFEPDRVILLLCRDELLERFFPDVSSESEPVAEGTWILSCLPELGRSLLDSTLKPVLFGEENISRLQQLLPGPAASVRSGVLIPLAVHETVFGGLFLGSADIERYLPTDGTDLLEQLGIKIALCMENCLAYERRRDLGLDGPLTGLLGFFQIRAVLSDEFRRAQRNGTPLSALIVDVGFVQDMEDLFDVRRDIIRHVGELLGGTLPGGESYVGRFGSSELLVVLPNVGEEEAQEVVPYLTQIIRKAPYRHGNAVILLQCRMGVGSLKEGMLRSQELLDGASDELCRLKARQAADDD